jgi:hypothetical protein
MMINDKAIARMALAFEHSDLEWPKRAYFRFSGFEM